MTKKWQIKPTVSREFVAKFPEISGIVLQLLYNRGLDTTEKIDDFLNPSYEDILDPFLFSDMEKAVERILKAIQNKEKTLIYGDYDADGVCATAVLFLTLQSLGLEVETYIPFRESEGYGLNKKIVQQFKEQEFDLIITVDCGIANNEEISLLVASGIEVIVTDHHQPPPKLPPALAIINPSLKDSGYPFTDLCGAGVAFKLAQAIIFKQREKNSPLQLPAGFEKWLLDLVAIATVGDIVPLLGENRVLVKYGLMVLEKTKRLGLKKLLEATNSNYFSGIDAEYLSWRLVPRLNAAGRIDHASVAFNLLLAETEAEAQKLVGILETNNQKRQQLTEKILKEAEAQIGEVDENKKVLWAVGENWPIGVVGLVAGRLCDRYHRPTLIISRDGEKFTGSGRSIAELDITFTLGKVGEWLARFGGHSQACGFSAVGENNFNEFKEKFTQIIQEQLKDAKLEPLLQIEAEIKLADINWQLLGEMEKFEPFGGGNPKPLFAAYNLKIEGIQAVGEGGKHLRVIASQGDNINHIHKLIGFSFGDWRAKLKINDKIDIVFELGVNEWNGNRELQLKIIDLRLSC